METKQFTCLNGRFVLAHRAAVSVDDRGFRFGDGVFETIRVERGTPVYWEAHMQRLAEGLRALRITLPLAPLQPFARKLLLKNEAREGFLRIAVSRGVGSRGYLPHPPGMPASWVMEWLARPHTDAPAATLWLSSLAKIPPQCLPTQHKLAQGLNSTLALMEAQANGADEALQLTPSGELAEASSANLFWLHGGTLHTPALETGCLGGTTRAAILRLAPYPTKLVQAGLSDLQGAEAVFLTNTRVGVQPVKALQPAGWQFNATHFIHRQMLALLTTDRLKDVMANRAAWSHA